MSLRKLASSVAFCCARAPTKVSNAPTIASATYNSQRHRSAFLWIVLPTDAVIPYLPATREREYAGDVPTRVAYASVISFLLQELLFRDSYSGRRCCLTAAHPYNMNSVFPKGVALPRGCHDLF